MLPNEIIICVGLLIYFLGVIVSFLVASRIDKLSRVRANFGQGDIVFIPILWPIMLLIIIVASIVFGIYRAIIRLYLNASSTYNEQNRS